MRTRKGAYAVLNAGSLGRSVFLVTRRILFSPTICTIGPSCFSTSCCHTSSRLLSPGFFRQKSAGERYFCSPGSSLCDVVTFRRVSGRNKKGFHGHRFFATRAEDSQKGGHQHGTIGEHDCAHSSHGHSHSHGAVEAHIEGRDLRDCKRVTLVGLGTNIFFSTTKLLAGSAGGSVALMADGFHALTDIFADLISYVTMSLSRKRFSHCKFPFGIGRLETLGTVTVASVLFIGGVLLLWDSAWSFLKEWVFYSDKPDLQSSRVDVCATPTAQHGADASASHSSGDHCHAHAHGGVGHSHFALTATDETGVEHIMWVMIALAGSSVVCKELLFWWARSVGKRAGSRVVVANAYHHRADAWSAGVTLFGLAGQSVGIPGADGLAGLIVSYCICQVGYQLTKEAVLELFDYQRLNEVREVRQRLQQFQLYTTWTEPCQGGDGSKHRLDHWRRENTRPMRSSVGKSASPSATTFAYTDAHSDPSVLLAMDSSSPSSSSVLESTVGAFHRKGEEVRVSEPKRMTENELVDRVRFINIFLLRHGHTYAVHVTLLICASLCAQEIASVTAQMSENASTQLSSTNSTMNVEGTFITLLICDLDQVEYRPVVVEAATEKEKQRRGEGSDQPKVSTRTLTSFTSPAALGDVIQPSLERCISALMKFHDFAAPIRYRWEDRVLYIPIGNRSSCHSHASCCSTTRVVQSHIDATSTSPSADTTEKKVDMWARFLNIWPLKMDSSSSHTTSDECLEDVFSVAEMFKCKVEFV